MNTPAPRPDAATWRAAMGLFDQARDLSGPARQAWLDELAQRQPELLAAVTALLDAAADATAAAVLDAGPALEPDLAEHLALSPGGASAGTAGAPQAGQSFGRYRLVRPLGRGGMAEVWLAEPADGIPAALVALKLPLYGPGPGPYGRLSSGRTLAQGFARERDILAALEHPHIARLYDAGAVPDGPADKPSAQPGDAAEGQAYLVMEWVDGQPIDAWCDTRQLGIDARLALAQQVLEAVQFAHSRLVIHRDIKPSNVLVNQDGQVKLLDFGIAKLLPPPHEAGAAPEATQATGQLLTPAYASPEQVRGETVTPATDVYALGVLLFELLTGHRPYREGDKTPLALQQAILTADIRRASQAVADATPAIAQARHSTPAHLRRRLAGDLDAILAKALQQDPAQRYDSARALADDLRRHQTGRPVLAQPESWAYLLRKFISRHRTASGAALAVVLALAAGGGMAAFQAQQASEARDRALAALARAEATQRFMVDLLTETARTGQPMKVDQLMARAETEARRALADRPDELASVLGIVGGFFSATGNNQRALGTLNEALGMAGDAQLQAELDCAQAYAAGYQAAPEPALARLRARAQDPSLPPATRSGCQLTLAHLLLLAGRMAESAAQVEAAWPALQTTGPAGLHQRAWAVTMLSYLRADQGQPRLMEARNQAVMDQLQASGRGRGTVARGLHNTWGTLNLVAGEPRKTLAHYEAIVRMLEEDQPDQGPGAYNLMMWATPLIALGRLDEARAALQRAEQAALATDDAATAFSARCQTGRTLALAGRAAEAAQQFDRALQVPDGGQPLRGNFGPFCDMARGEAAAMAGRVDEALALVRPLLQLAPGSTARPTPPSVRLNALMVQAEAELARGQAAAARPAVDEALALARRFQGDNPHSHRTGQALLLQARVLDALGQRSAALPVLAEAQAQLSATVEPGQRHLALTRQLQQDWSATAR